MALTIQNGYVIYTRGAESDSPYWKRVHEKAVAEAGSIHPLYSKDQDRGKVAGEYLLSLGQAEQAKEISLIQQATGNSNIETEDIKIFIQNFNEILMGKQQFQATITRLRAALSKPNQGKDSRAPTIASWFSNALGTALNQNLNAFTSQNIDSLIAQDFSVWESQIDSIINKSIEEAFKNLLTKMEDKMGKEIYGTQSSWKEIYEASQQMQGFNQYFQQMIRSKIDFDKIKNIFQNESVKITNKTHRGFRKFIDSQNGLNLRNEKKSRSLGGSVQEYIESIINSIGLAAQSAASSGGRVFSAEKMKADNVTLYSYSEKIGDPNLAQRITDQLNEEMIASTSLQDSVNIMENYWNNYLSKLDNSFIVYGSTKAYSMSSSFAGFHGGGERSLEDAKAIIAQAGFGSSADDFINLAYNTGNGAIFSNQRGEVMAQLETALSAAVANLLFDDWVSIGQTSGGVSAIHVLELNGLKVPLSIFLIAAGKAMIAASNDTKKVVRIKVKLPTSYLYPEPIETKGGHMSEIIAAWNEQAATSKKEASFSLTFLKNFKELVSEWINF